MYKFLLITLILASLQVSAITPVEKDTVKIDSVVVIDSIIDDLNSVSDTIIIIDTVIDTAVKTELPSYNVSEVNVYNLEADADECHVLTICDDNEHFAVRLKRDSLWALDYPGINKQFFRNITVATISPDCKHLAYGIYDGDNSYLYVDNNKINKDLYLWISPKYNLDGSQLLYFKENWSFLGVKPRRIIVVDSTEYKYDKILGTNPVTWSPDKKHWASLAKKGKSSFLVLDGVRGPNYDNCKIGPLFSYDSKQIVYTGIRNDTTYLAIINKVNGRFNIEVLSNKSVKYFEKDKLSTISSYYKEVGAYREIYGFQFFDSSYKYIMQTSYNFDHYIVTSDTTYGPYDTTFSIVFDNDDNYSFIAKKDNEFIFKTFDNKFETIDTEITNRAKSIRALKYSDDFSQHAFVVEKYNQPECLYANNSLVECWRDMYFGNFYPNSYQLYYYGSEKKSTVSFCSGDSVFTYSSVSPVKYSSDGSIRVAVGYSFSSEGKSEGEDLIINEKVYGHYSDISGGYEFDKNDTITFFVTKNKHRIFKLVISPNEIIETSD